jgi:hypothetical protein
VNGTGTSIRFNRNLDGEFWSRFNYTGSYSVPIVKRYFPGVVPKEDKKSGFFNYSWPEVFLRVLRSRSLTGTLWRLRCVQ